MVMDTVKRNLPAAITSYDLLKMAAVTLMIVDHAGYYFFNEEQWFRIAGRLCVPMWFFLIGYARSRDLGAPLWIGCAVLVLANIPAGMFILPLNILGSIIIVRLVLNPLMDFMLAHERFYFWRVCAMLPFLYLPARYIGEYGSLGVILAIFGYLVRRCQDGAVPEKLVRQYMIYAALSFVLIQYFEFGTFSQLQFMALCIGIVPVMAVLYFFRAREFLSLTNKIPGPAVSAIQFFGRYTLYIYVGHLLLFKWVAMYSDPARFTFMDWTFFPAV